MTARLYNSLTLSMLVSVIISQNEWLDMRANMGWVFFCLIVILFVIQSSVKSFRGFCSTFAVSLACLAVSFAGMYLVLGHEGILVIPASIIREGLMQNRLTFSALNSALIVVALAGLIAVFFTSRNER